MKMSKIEYSIESNSYIGKDKKTKNEERIFIHCDANDLTEGEIEKLLLSIPSDNFNTECVPVWDDYCELVCLFNPQNGTFDYSVSTL